MVDDPRIGGLSAIYSIDKHKFSGGMATFLVAGQRAQFAAFNMDNLLRGRNMAVLGGQCSLFSVHGSEEGHGAAPPAGPVGARLRGRGLQALAADQGRRLQHEDQLAGPGLRSAR